MDLRLLETPAKPEEQAAVDAVLGSPDSGWRGGLRTIAIDGHEARGGRALQARRHLLLPALHAVQDRMGWISPEALNYICQRLDIPPAEAYGVASFYALFFLTPQPATAVHVCDDIACLASGAKSICEELERAVGPAGARSKDGQMRWLRSPCLGLCERAPAALMVTAGASPQAQACAPFQPSDLSVMKSARSEEKRRQTIVPQAGDAKLRLLRRVGGVDPTSLDSYRAYGGYAALRKAIELGPDGVLREVNDSKLLGRGGAAFPMSRKWEAVVHAAARPHYLVCNADESEPGTFKDRVVMEEDPFALIEAMTIAGFATASEQGYIYLRGEYPLAAERLSNAIRQARPWFAR